MSATRERAEWLAQRRRGIGGTDISAILGLNPWRTPTDVWMEKTDRAQPEHTPDALERMHWGIVLEDVVARHYAERTACRVQRINAMMHHPDLDIALANVDRAIVHPGSRARWNGQKMLGADEILECKTAHALAANSDEWGAPGTDEVPAHYWMQVQWYLGITQVPVGRLAVLFGGQKFAIYTIEHDPDLFSDLLLEADTWWQNHMIADLPPDPHSEAEARQRWQSHADGKESIVDVEIASAVDELRQVKDQIKALETRDTELRDLITPAFQDAERIVHAGRRLATWKITKPRRVTDWKSCAMAAGADDALIAEHTTEKPGARVLRLAKEVRQ